MTNQAQESETREQCRGERTITAQNRASRKLADRKTNTSLLEDPAGDPSKSKGASVKKTQVRAVLQVESKQARHTGQTQRDAK